MTQKRIPIPPRLGGGDVVMRELSCGEYEDQLRVTGDAKWVERLAENVCAAIVTFKGEAVPAGIEREAWWRKITAAQRQFLAGCYNQLNAVSDKEIETFFGAAEPA